MLGITKLVIGKILSVLIAGLILFVGLPTLSAQAAGYYSGNYSTQDRIQHSPYYRASKTQTARNLTQKTTPDYVKKLNNDKENVSYYNHNERQIEARNNIPNNSQR